MTRTGRTIAGLALAGVAWFSAETAAQPVLTADRAVQLALEQNSQIISASAGVLDARGGVYGALAGVLPQVSAGITRSGSWTRNQRGVQIFGGGFAVPSSTDRYESYSTQPVLSGQWNALNLSSLSGLRAARSSLKAAQWQRASARNEVALLARQQFYEVVKAVRLVDVSASALQLARDNGRRVQALFDVGSVSRSDVLRAQVNTSQAVLDSISAQQSVLVQRAGLAGLIGLEESKLGEVDTVLTVTPQSFEEAGLLAEAVANRPDLKTAADELRAARASLWAARLQRLPYVTVSGSVALSPASSSKSEGVDEDGVPFTISGRNEADRQTSARVAVNWDLFDGLATDARNAQARARLMRAQNAYDVLQRELRSGIHEAVITYQQALAGEATASAARASALENLKLIQQKYNVGSATILDLIDAQVQLQRAESQEVSALAAIRVAEAQVQRARGRLE
jgi:outer membrane protein TolC